MYENVKKGGVGVNTQHSEKKPDAFAPIISELAGYYTSLGVIQKFAQVHIVT